MNTPDARERLSAARVARLATVGADGRPHVVPITFAVISPDTIAFAVDHKPKRTIALRRLANIAANPQVAVLADHYDDDWSARWWVRADGVATIHDATRPEWSAALAARYPQYADRPPSGPAVAIEVTRWSGWSAG